MNNNEITNVLLKKIRSGKIKPHEIENYVDQKSAVEIRRKYFEEMLGIKLEKIGNYCIEEKFLYKKNIENMIGAVQVPVGIVEDLLVKGKYAKGRFCVPLATTEGALVASINRGSNAISMSGGAATLITRDGMTRSVAFLMKDLDESEKLSKWISDEQNFNVMQDAVSKTSRIAKITAIQPYVAGEYMFLRFIFDTGDAMGMNMATIASDAISGLIQKELGIKEIALSGNMCVDKKPSALNLFEGRGKSVVARVVISNEVAEDVLKSDIQTMQEVCYAKNMIGSSIAGSLGHNAQVANVAAAIYLACGQDIAHVVSASLALTSMKKISNDELLCTLTAPCIEVGTVGGGTSVETQRECLSVMGVAGSGNPIGHNAKKFAEIIAAAMLAGEISLIAALASGTLAKSHQSLGRKKYSV